jgi:hypothetical protein
MKSFLSSATALALILSAASAMAQDAPAPPTSVSAGPSDATPGSYWGVDTSGTRVDVQAPYGGNSQRQADRKEAPMTDHLNQQALQAATPHP